MRNQSQQPKLLAQTQPFYSGLHVREMLRVARIELTARRGHHDWLETLAKEGERVQHEQMIFVLPELVGHEEKTRRQPVTVGNGTSLMRRNGRKGWHGKAHDVRMAYSRGIE